MTQPETITDAVPSDSNIDNKETTVLSAADDSTTVNDIPKYNPIEGDAENEMESVEMLNALALSQSRIGDGLTSKHPLQCEWTLWFDSPSKKTNQTNWHDNVKQVYTFGTVEDFWAYVELSFILIFVMAVKLMSVTLYSFLKCASSADLLFYLI
jgi:hypothetical protein